MSTNGTPASAPALKGLPADLIANLMATSRTRNAYGPKLVEFDNSDEAAINPAEAWPIDFGGKKTSTLYQGFRLAIEKADLKDKITVKLSDDSVFLLHNERVHILLAAEAEEAEPVTA